MQQHGLSISLPSSYFPAGPLAFPGQDAAYTPESARVNGFNATMPGGGVAVTKAEKVLPTASFLILYPDETVP
jgi:hypothetical protein